MSKYRIYQLDDAGKLAEPPAVGIWKDDNEAQMHARVLLSNSVLEI